MQGMTRNRGSFNISSCFHATKWIVFAAVSDARQWCSCESDGEYLPHVGAMKEIIAYSSQTLKHIQIIDTCMNGTLESGIFGKCEKLQHLQLSGNRLYGEFPRVPSSLQTLIIYNTPFSGRFSLAREMTNLTMFGAYETCIETIDWQGWKPALRVLSLVVPRAVISINMPVKCYTASHM